MITYQDLLQVDDSDKSRAEFVLKVINDHKGSKRFIDAAVAVDYAHQQNTTIMAYQKLLYTAAGQAVPDNFSANYKLASNFFYRFITQQNQYLLGNGISWTENSTKDKLGDDFEERVQEAGYNALVSGVAFGFWNLNHLEVFPFQEFAPLYDEENGALMAGVRFWRIDNSKPLRATLYELDGYTDYIWRAGQDAEVLHAKRPYIIKTQTSVADGEIIYGGENYPSFPIVPLWGNQHKQSELTGLREEIDAYDLIKSGFANDLDDASQIYWIIQNAGGMDEIDLAKFVERMKTVKAAVVEDDGAHAEAHTLDVPYNARESLLERLRGDMYDDFMALDTKAISGGAITATQIQAAYEPLNNKTDMYEYQVTKFIKGILKLAGIDDTPSYTRSVIVNKQEEIQIITQASQYLSEDYTTEKILTLLGDADKIDEIMLEKDEEDMNRFQAQKEFFAQNDNENNEQEEEEE